MIAKIPRSFGTHNGTFHADEVTACALLILFDLIDKTKIKRTRDPDALATCEFVCDVGGEYDSENKYFDHHQVEYTGEMSSAGMVLLYLKDKKIITEEEYNFLDFSIIKGVDAHDNGRDPQIPGLCTYSHVIANFVPIDYEATSEEQDQAFRQALQFAIQNLERILARFHYMQSCREVVAQAMEKYHDCLMFDKSIPWIESFFKLGGESHPARYLIMPSGEHWKLRAIPPSYQDRMNVRSPLPKEWAGLLDKELQKVTGIPGAIFCHKGRFISVWKTKEDAIKALNIILNS